MQYDYSTTTGTRVQHVVRINLFTAAFVIEWPMGYTGHLLSSLLDDVSSLESPKKKICLAVLANACSLDVYSYRYSDSLIKYL